MRLFGVVILSQSAAEAKNLVVPVWDLSRVKKKNLLRGVYPAKSHVVCGAKSPTEGSGESAEELLRIVLSILIKMGKPIWNPHSIFNEQLETDHLQITYFEPLLLGERKDAKTKPALGGSDRILVVDPGHKA